MRVLVVGEQPRVEQLFREAGYTVERAASDQAAALAREHYDLVLLGGAEAAAWPADSDHRLRAHHLAFMERAADGVFTHRSDGSVAYVNPAFVSFLGYSSSSELLGRPVLELVHPEDRTTVEQRISTTLTSHQPSRPRPIRFLGRDGSTRYAETRGIYLAPDDEPLVTVIARDLTERRKANELEQQLHQAQKMEVVGRLAGGIAHEFNNILTTIRGYSELLLEQVGPGSTAHNAARHIHRSSLRAAGLTEQLLVFTRKRPPQPRMVQLNDVVRQMGGLLRRVIGEDIQLELRLLPALGRVFVDPGQMEQMILNLAINARDAMAKGGHLLIETGDHGANEIRLTVEDDGSGMDEATRAHMFEPFFTTKEQGKGTGLGLSIVQAIIEQAGGSITVDTSPGRGTCFHIFFKRADESQPQAERVTPLPTTSGPVGSETVLIAEDDEEVREFVELVLKRAGYHVLAAADGEAAIKLSQSYPGEISLLLSDVVMPHVDGRALAEHLVSQRPRLSVLHMSGYPGDTVARYGDVPEAGAFLQKPFSAVELTQRVRQILDEQAVATR